MRLARSGSLLGFVLGSAATGPAFVTELRGARVSALAVLA